MTATAVWGASPQRTTSCGLKVAPVERAVSADTLAAQPGMVAIAGYEKTLRSTREALLVTSSLEDDTISGVKLRLVYSDLHGRMLHSREVELPVTVPPGETRQATFRAWDTQHTYYYRLNQAPARAQGTPYDVVATPVWITVIKKQK